MSKNLLQISDIKKAVYEWINSLGLYPPNSIVYDEQNVKRPNGNYSSYKIISLPTKRGTDSLINVSGDKFKFVGQRKFTVSVKCYGTTAQQNIIDMHTSLEFPSSDDIFAKYNMAVWDDGAPSDISTKIETGFEIRTYFDIIFGTMSEVENVVGYIASTSIEGTIKEVNGVEVSVSTQVIPTP